MAVMRIDIVTLFPGMVEPVVAESILGRARTRGLVDIRVVNLRDYAEGRHRITDDYQFGGGGGMVLKPEPLFAAVEALRTPGARVILTDPRGRRFTQEVAAELTQVAHLILLAGRYEGVDERVGAGLADEMISIGDYVLTGGELPALVMADAVTRLMPGVLGAEGAAERESFASGLLEPPQYTRPEEFRGARVPGVLLSGDHARIARWRRLQALYMTWRRRPDLLATATLDADEKHWIERFERGETLPDDGRALAKKRKKEPSDGRDSAGRGRAHEEGPGGVFARRSGARAREGHRGREGADAGLRGHRDPSPGRRAARLVHRAPHLLRGGRGAHVPARTRRGSSAWSVMRRGQVRRSKLYYLRSLAGKAARIKEKRASAVPATAATDQE